MFDYSVKLVFPLKFWAVRVKEYQVSTFEKFSGGGVVVVCLNIVSSLAHICQGLG